MVTSAICKHQQWFRLDVQRSSLVHSFNNIFFKWAFVPGWTINEFPAFANTRPVKMRELLIGNFHPIRVQAMTTTDTIDTTTTVEQSIRCIEAGAEFVGEANVRNLRVTPTTA